MAVLRYMGMFLPKLYLLWATIVLLVDGAKWDTRYPVYTTVILQDIVMDCIIDGGANFTGFYRQNGGEIVNTDRIKIKRSDISNIVTLEMVKITEADYDTYFCNDTSGSDKATLEIQASLEQNPESPQILLAGESGEIEYRVYGNPRPKMLTWYLTRTGETKMTLASLDGKGTLVDTSGGRYTIDMLKGTLKINKIRADDGGKYSISVSSYSGGRDNGFVTVKIEFKLELKVKPPKSYVRAVGQDLFIPCKFLYADSDTKWTFTSSADGTVKIISIGASENGLNLTSVSIASEGTYTCSASNKYGNDSASSNLSQVIDPAKITTDFKGVEKRQLTTDYELVCAAAGKPKPNVKLYKLKEDKSALEHITSGVGQVTKKFSKLSITDGGLYSCYVDNGAKTLKGASMAETRNMTLEVYASTEIVVKTTTKSIVSAISLNFTIQCSAKGYPYPNVKLIGNGQDITTNVEREEDVVTAKIVVTKAKQSNFAYENITCFATNAYGTENATIPLTQILKAPCPKKLKNVGTIGLSNIDLQWGAVLGADKYYIYINDSRKMEESIINQINIKKLKRKTYYSIKVASVNLAGVGNHCGPFLFETADIVKPNAIAVAGFNMEDVTSQSATISWEAPSNIPDRDVLTYEAKFCLVRNGSIVEDTCQGQGKERKENRLQLKGLVPKTNYQIVVTAINQGKRGLDSEPFKFQTKEVQQPTTAPSASASQGLSSGEIAGIIVAIILIVLIVVDVFCCFFNNCGFSHCCFETFCASKDKKFLPVDTNDTNGANEAEGYEAQELEEKPPNDVV